MVGENLFFRLLNMSITGGAVILLFLILRPLLKRLPKKYLCLLWLIPVFRLLVPASVPLPFSLLPLDPEPIMKTTTEGVGVAALNTGIRFIDVPVNLILIDRQMPEGLTSANPLQIWAWVGLRLWAAGAVLFPAVHFFRYWRLKRAVAEAVPGGDGVYYSDWLSMPMVLGILRPRIYLPALFLREENAGEKALVLEHEKAHKKRRDHLTKLLAFAALAVHWFNPLVWAAYFMLCRDMEMACDELVMEKLGEERKTEYSLALLHFEERRSMLLLPLAFGESHTESRIKNILNYRKPRFWAGAAGVCLLVFAALTLLSDPRPAADTEMSMSIGIIGGADGPTSIFLAGKLPDDSGENGSLAEELDPEAVKGQPWGTNVELDLVSAGKISFHGYFGYLVFTLGQSGDGALTASLHRAVTLSEIGGIFMQGDRYTEIISGDGAAWILPGVYDAAQEEPELYLYMEESGRLERQTDADENDAVRQFVETLRQPDSTGRLRDAVVAEEQTDALMAAVEGEYGSGTAVLYGPVGIPEYSSEVYGFLAADGGNVGDLWYGIWRTDNGQITRITLFD